MDNNELDQLEFDVEAVSPDLLSEMGFDIVDAQLELPADFEEVSHAEIASEAQSAADAAIQVGDYAAAQELREIAEQEAWEAGDSSMLHGSDSVQLESAAESVDRATELEALQSEAIADGDYAAAKEYSQAAAMEMGDADFLAGGNDHTGQADLEVANLDWATWHEDVANDMVENAMDHFEAGNFDAAENALDSAAGHFDHADEYADAGDHFSSTADFDPSSTMESNSVDTYSSSSTLDTSYDSGVDTSTDFSE
ncbi:MAG: hypothetical protein R3C03_00195 [Pirellulaceae bacterium]